MNATTTVRAAAAALLCALAAVVPATAAQAAPPSNGCPAGFDLVSQYFVDNEVYQVPSLMDDVLGSHGRPPLSDDLICAKLIGKTIGGYPLYNFLDNTLPASSNS